MALRQLVIPARRRAAPQVLTVPLSSCSAPAVPRHTVPPAAFKPLHRCHAAQAAPAAPSSERDGASKLSSTANSYISLGKFETMGENQGRMAMGIAYLEEAIQMQEGQYANEADARKKSAKGLGLAQSRLQVGRQHHQQQDAAEAIGHYTRALELIEDAITVLEKDEESASKKAVKYAKFLSTEILSGLGVAYNDVGRREEALTMLQRTLAQRREMLGKEHPSVAECLNNLGALFFGRRAFGKAAEHYEQALELLTNAAGGQQDGPYIALTFYNIGLCRMELEQLPAAVASMRKALRIAERSLGSDHTQVGLIKATLEQIMGGPVPSQGDPSAFPFAAPAPPSTSEGSAPAGAQSASQQKKE